MKPSHKWIIALVALLMILVSIGSASAALVDSFDFNDNITDETGSYDFLAQNSAALTTVYPTFGISGDGGNGSQNFVAASSQYLVSDTVDEITTRFEYDSNWTVSYWAYNDALSKSTHMSSYRGAGSTYIRFSPSDLVGGGDNNNYRVYIQDSGQAIDFDVEDVGKAGEWQMWTVVYRSDGGAGGENATAYLNTTKIGSGENAAISNDFFNAGDKLQLAANNAGLFFDGKIDHLRVYSHALNTTEIANLYNYGDISGAPAAATPQVTLEGPADNDHDNTNPQTSFNYNLTQTANITLWTNTSGGGWVRHANATSVQVDAGNDRNFTGTIVLGEGSIQWKIQAVNGNGSSNSSTRTLFQDYTNPVVNLDGGNVTHDNTTVINYHLDGNNVDVNLQALDTYLYGFNVTVIGTVSGKIYSNQTLGLTGAVFDSNNSVNLATACGGSLCPVQEFAVHVNISDDHTKPIPDYQVNTVKSRVTFKPGNDNNIKIETREAADITAEKAAEGDRYVFTMTFDDGLTKRREFDIKTDLCPISHRESSPYKGHLVSACGVSGNWIDFEGAGANATVSRVDDYHYTVVVESVEPVAVWRSVGGLNVINQEVARFNWSLTARNPTALNGTSKIDHIELVWTNRTEASFMEVWRDSSNVANVSAAASYNDTGLAANTAYAYKIYSVYNNSETYIVNTTATANENSRTFTTLTNTSISIVLYDEITRATLTGRNCSVNFISNSNNQTEDTLTGAIPFQGLPTNNYTMRHTCDDYVLRDQYLELVNNSVNTIPLYLISNNASSVLPVTVKNLEGRVLSGCRINWQRWYTTASTYTTVEMANTSRHGETNLYYEAENAYYRPIITCGSAQDSTITPRRYTSGDGAGVNWLIDVQEDVFESWVPIGSALPNPITYDVATRSFSWVYEYPASFFDEACLQVKRIDRKLEVAVNTTCSSSNSGTLVTSHPATNNTLKAVAIVDSNTANSQYIANTRWLLGATADSVATFGGLGLLATGIFISILGLVSSAHPAVPIIGAVLGLFGGWLGLGLAITPGTIITIAAIGLGIIGLFAWRSGR